MEKISLSPVTRISGLLSIDVFLGTSSEVIEANCIGEQFRGFEIIMKGRKVTDAVYLTQRICGICSMAHGYTASRLVAKIYGLEPAPEAILLQQLMLGAEFLQNHIRHFYLLALPDYLNSDLLPGYIAVQEEHRFTHQQQQLLVEHYFAAMEYSRKCHEMLAVFGGKIPHQHGLTAGGVAVTPSSYRKLQFLSLLKQVQDFIQNVMLPDLDVLARVYREYFNIGIRPPQFISFGLFEPDFGGHFSAGIFDGRTLIPLSLEQISESIVFSWFQSNKAGEMVPAPDKAGAYSWVKAPRYHGMALEGGPLARKVIRHGGSFPTATGALSRLLARVEEAALISAWMESWLQALPEDGEYLKQLGMPMISTAVQANDAPRGPLLHKVTVQDDDVTSYDVITPSTWNFSPKDGAGQRGPVEEALVGSFIGNPANPVEVGRIIRSFDPCLTCGTHLIDWEGRNLFQVNVLV